MGGREKAAAQLPRGIRLDPGYAEAHVNLGEESWRTRATMRGRSRRYEEALRIRPGYALAREDLAELKARGAR